MPEIVAQFYEGGFWNVQYRLYTPEGEQVEPIARMPMRQWSEYKPTDQDTWLSYSVMADRMAYPHYTEVPPDGTDRADAEPSEGSTESGRDRSGLADDHR